MVQQDSEIPHVIRALLALKLTWLDQKGLYARFLASGQIESWLVAICTRARLAGQLHLSTLSAGGRIVVVQLAFVSGRTLNAYIGAFDTGYRRYGVGKLHLEDHLADIAARGLALDLMPPEDDYKLEWGVPGVRVCSSLTPLSARGRILAFAQNPNLRGVLKRLYMAIPRPVRARSAAAILAMAAAVRRALMAIAASISELAPHAAHLAALA